jgi:predicted AlkP superfamily pyrophosphatase or phosphodiesterase
MIDRFRGRFAALLILIFVGGTVSLFGQAKVERAAKQAPQARSDAHVIMISIDGMVPDYYTEPSRIGLKDPALVQMKLDGAYANGVEGVYPTVTYPSHTTLITGVLPATHGIVQNRIFEPPTEPQTGSWYWYARALKSETLWSLAKKSGLVTAAVSWPVTVEADIDYNLPEVWDPSEKPITGKRMVQYSTPGLVQKALDGKVVKGDEFRTVVSEYIIKAYRPNLMLIHLVELDDSHHKNGPRTPGAIETMEREDGYIARIIQAVRSAGIFDKTTFFIVSDHGFATIDKKFEPNVVLVKEKLITLGADHKPTGWKAAAWPAGGSCAVVLKDPADKDTAAKVMAVFSNIAKKNSSPINRVVQRPELDRLGAIPEATIMLEAAPGYSFDEALTGPEVHSSGQTYLGTHGYLPSRVEMRSALLIYGDAARAGARLGLARMIDIGPTAAAVLGFWIPDAEGRPIEALLRPGVMPPPDPDAAKKKPKRNKSGPGKSAPAPQSE